MADYQAKLAEFKARDISVIALSVDPLEKAREIVEESKLEFPLAYGLKVPLSCLTVLTGNKLVLRDYLAPELLDKLAPIGPG